MTRPKPAAGELHTIEQSHGKPRLTRPRPTDLGTVPTGADRSRDQDAAGRFTHGNQAARGRGARSALRAPYRAAARRISEALDVGAEPETADVLLHDAMLVFETARAELGSRSVFVQGPTIAYAIETTLAGYFHAAAAKAGHDTDAGAALLERAQSCETHAARAMTAALAAVKALGGKRQRKTLSIVQQIEREADAELAAARLLPAGNPDPKGPSNG